MINGDIPVLVFFVCNCTVSLLSIILFATCLLVIAAEKKVMFTISVSVISLQESRADGNRCQVPSLWVWSVLNWT